MYACVTVGLHLFVFALKVAELLVTEDCRDPPNPLASGGLGVGGGGGEWAAYVRARRRAFCSDDTLLRCARSSAAPRLKVGTACPSPIPLECVDVGGMHPRYLRARDADVDAALVMLTASLRWREVTNRVGALRELSGPAQVPVAAVGEEDY